MGLCASRTIASCNERSRITTRNQKRGQVHLIWVQIKCTCPLFLSTQTKG